jgi:hypothetical protein
MSRIWGLCWKLWGRTGNSFAVFHALFLHSAYSFLIFYTLGQLPDSVLHGYGYLRATRILCVIWGLFYEYLAFDFG